METAGFIIGWLICFIPACIILNKKMRGIGYYILAFVWPLIGLIVALCLRDKSNDDDCDNLDITQNRG
jgi:hypothetical protein